MNRRTFLQRASKGAIAIAAAAVVPSVLDPERELWTPGKVTYIDLGSRIRHLHVYENNIFALCEDGVYKIGPDMVPIQLDVPREVRFSFTERDLAEPFKLADYYREAARRVAEKIDLDIINGLREIQRDYNRLQSELIQPELAFRVKV